MNTLNFELAVLDSFEIKSKTFSVPFFSWDFRCSFQTFEPQILLTGLDSRESEKGQLY